MPDTETKKEVKRILRGSKFREGHGLSRTWFYWECEICNGKTEWYLNEDAMKKGSQAHMDFHKKDK